MPYAILICGGDLDLRRAMKHTRRGDGVIETTPPRKALEIDGRIDRRKARASAAAVTDARLRATLEIIPRVRSSPGPGGA